MRNPFLRPESANGSFLPPDYVARKVEMRANLICLTLFGVVMFCVVAAFFVTNRQWLNVRREQATITVQYTQEAQKIEQLKKLEAQKSEMMTKAEITTALIEKVPRSVLLAELITKMPGGITLLELGLEGQKPKEAGASGGTTKNVSKAPSPGVKNLSASTAPGKLARPGPGKAKEETPAEAPKPEQIAPPKLEYSLKLVGVARMNNDIADYITALKDCKLLDRVELKYIKETVVEKQELRKFEISAAIRKEADARGIEPVDLRKAAAAKDAGPKPDSKVTGVPEGKDGGK